MFFYILLILLIDFRQWAQDCDFAAENLFQKFFYEDINYLLSMDKLWAKRKKPQPLNWKELPEETSASDVEKEKESQGIKDQKVWSIKKCAMIFEESLGKLKDRYKVTIALGIIIIIKLVLTRFLHFSIVPSSGTEGRRSSGLG